jgi:hypothetical protein
MPRTDPFERAKAERLESRVLLDGAAGECDGYGSVPAPADARHGAAVAATAPNLHVVEAFLTDSNFTRLAGAPIEGQSYGIRVNFATESLPVDAQYTVNYEVNGLTIPGVVRTLGAGAESGSFWVGRRYVFARSGPHDVRVVMDPGGTVAESDESDNEARFAFTPAPGAPPQQLALPVEGVGGKDWAPVNYVDLDPRDGLFADYRGRGYAVDAHLGLDLAISDFEAMDRGVGVFAAAAGTVSEVHDGEFDRNTTLLDPPPPANYVIVDHGGGWQTRYWHLRNGSVAVTPGQAVAAGQKLGLVGSSGYSTGSHLHFALTYNGEWVETFLDPLRYWQQPPAFAADTPGAFAITPTDAQPPDLEMRESIVRRHVFHPGEKVYAVTNFHGLNREVVRTNRFFRPDGSEYRAFGNPGARDFGKNYRYVFTTLPADAAPGQWSVNFELDGIQYARTTFAVAPPPGLPEIKVMDGTGYVIDGRTTPLDLGAVERAGGASVRVLTVRNHGTAPLTLTGVTLPAGFSTTESFPITVPGWGGFPPAPGEVALTIQLDDQVVGSKTGRVTIHSDDADQGEYDFAVAGRVTGVPAAVEQAFVNGTTWNPDFRAYLQDQDAGSDEFGFALPTPAAGQTPPLPWANLNQLSLRFNTDVPIEAGDLSVRGVSVNDYPTTGFAYDPARRTATWTLGDVLRNDRLTLTLNPRVTGSPVAIPLNVLPGDVNRSGAVLADDFSEVKKKFFRSTANVGTGDGAYDVFHDVTGSGAILADDFSEVKKRFFNTLPPADPAAASVAARRRESWVGRLLGTT